MFKYICLFLIIFLSFNILSVKLEDKVIDESVKVPVEPVKPIDNQVKKVVAVVNKNVTNSNVHVKPIVTSDAKSSSDQQTEREPVNPGRMGEKMSMQLTPDAFLRGFYVFAGLGALVILYFGVNILRVQKAPSLDSTVHKYGVKAKRGDLEMLPLPLAEEDEDDTLFDVEHHIVRAGN